MNHNELIQNGYLSSLGWLSDIQRDIVMVKLCIIQEYFKVTYGALLKDNLPLRIIYDIASAIDAGGGKYRGSSLTRAGTNHLNDILTPYEDNIRNWLLTSNYCFYSQTVPGIFQYCGRKFNVFDIFKIPRELSVPV